jgi:predicted solute-binding protein
LPFIAEWYSSRLPVTAPDIRSYLTRNLDFSLDVDNQRGLQRFFELAGKLGLIDRIQPLRFADIPKLQCRGQEDAGSV